MIEKILLLTALWIVSGVLAGVLWVVLCLLFTRFRKAPPPPPRRRIAMPHETRGITQETALVFRMEGATPVNVCRTCGPTPLALEPDGNCWKCAPIVHKVHAGYSTQL